MARITSDLAREPETPPRGVSGGSPDDFRRDNIAGSHGRLGPKIQHKKETFSDFPGLLKGLPCFSVPYLILTSFTFL